MIINEVHAKKAAQHLAEYDDTLAPVIARTGSCTIRPHRNYYQALVHEVIGQQLHIKAAATIRNRFESLFGKTFPTPEQILTTPVEELRAVGLSRAKASYIRDIAQHIVEGRLRFDHIDGLSNEAVVATLTDVKGIGEWSAHMFLMFCMGRTDILPVGDLGIRNGIRSLYNLDAIPNKADIEAIARDNRWHPYESIASWYIWQSLNNAPAV